MSEQREAFDPADPYQIMCEYFRRQVIELYAEADRITVFRDLPEHRKIGAFMVGVTTGLIGVPFVLTKREGHELVIQGLINSLPDCRWQAESIMRKQGLLR